MDRPNTRLRLFAGSITLLAAAGCSSFHHRGHVPPAPRAIRDGGGGAAFSSDPSPAVSARSGMMPPAGPVSSAGAYGPAGSYGGAPGGHESGSVPLGEPAAGTGGSPAGAGGAPPRGY